MLTLWEERSLSTTEVEIWVSSLVGAARIQSSRWGIQRLTVPEVGHHNRGNFGEDPGSSGESKQQDPVLKVLRAQYEPHESFLGWMDVYMKIGILHIESCKPHIFFPVRV